jgi:hypothetical protein
MDNLMGRLTLELDAEADPEELASLTRQLRNELLQLDVDSVELPTSGPAPDGSKAIDAVVLGQVVAQLAATADALKVVIGTVKAWLLRGRVVRSIKLHMDDDVLEVTGVSSEDQKRLIDAWIARHASE